ncbi:unnamed protein product, partial [Rotaria sp. Silwood1]
SGYRYRRANKSQIIWRCCRNDCAGRVRFDGTGYIKVTDHLHVPNPEETISVEFKSNISSGATISHNPSRRACLSGAEVIDNPNREADISIEHK